MIIEKYRYYDRQSIFNIPMAHAVNWANLTTYTAGVGGGCLACPDGLDWGQVLKYRESLYLKNQGKLNDNTTAGVIEIYFGPYHIDHITRSVSYSSTTGLYTFSTDPYLPAFVPVSDTSYLVFRPYDVSRASSAEDEVSLVLRNVINTAGFTYTFTLDGAEILVGGNAIGLWTAVADFTYAAATGWHHATGNITPLDVDTGWIPTVGVTYKLIVILSNVTVPGSGLNITHGGVGQANISANGTYVMYFTAETASHLIFNPGALGTWVGNISAVALSVHDKGANKLLQNNITNRKVDFYKYSIPALTTERGIILSCGESYSADITHDVCMYFRGTIDQSLLVQQLA